MPTYTLRWSDYAPPNLQGGAATVGNFDGVHRGHIALIQRARVWATSHSGPTIAITFDPPPIAILNPNAIKPPLMTLADRVAALERAGADHVVILATDASLLALSAEAFFEDVLLRQLGVRTIVEGFNFRFGRNRLGTTATLKELCANAGIGFEEVSPQFVRDAVVSSSRVRSAITVGDVALVHELLQNPYAIRGRVVEGAKRGRTIGFPTANLDSVLTQLPAVGVYATQVALEDRVYAAAANIGPNPTFGDDARKIELHLLDFSGDLYGRELRVEFLARIRDTQPFPNVDALIARLHRDIAETRRHVRLT